MKNDIYDIQPPATIHLIGICGTGMGALAGLLKQKGYTVTGSDAGAYPPMSDELHRLGIKLYNNYSADNLNHNPDLVVVGNVCTKEHIEAVAAKKHNIPFASFPQTLQKLLLPSKESLVVAGTHGKTTTTSLLAYLLEACGKDPSVLIGGVSKNFGTGYKLGNGPHFVIEGDEYDSAYFEKYAKFLSYEPKAAIITSIEHDHIDIYPDQESYFQAFASFAKLVQPGPLAIYSGDVGCRQILEKVDLQANVITYGVTKDPYLYEPTWLAAQSGTKYFELRIEGMKHGSWKAPLLGRHNLRNTLAALIIAHHSAQIPLKELKAALPDFGGIARRQQILGTPNDITVYDDFAHHPTAVQLTLDAIRSRHRKSKIIAAFEPRSATACRKLHQAQYAEAFRNADFAIIAPLGRDIPPSDALDTEQLVCDLNNRNISALAASSIAEVQMTIVNNAKPGDVVVLFSNGSFGGLHQKLLTALQPS